MGRINGAPPVIEDRVRDRQEMHDCEHREREVETLRLHIGPEARVVRGRLPDRLLQTVLECAPDRHDRADGLHRGLADPTSQLPFENISKFHFRIFLTLGACRRRLCDYIYRSRSACSQVAFDARTP